MSAVDYNKKRPLAPSWWHLHQDLVGAKVDGVPGAETAEKTAIWQGENGLTPDGKVGPVTLEKTGLSPIKFTERGFTYLGGMAIDCDGAPCAYNAGNTGIDYLGNAGEPGKWWGIVTVGGVPVVQGPRDIVPSYYVSTTAMVIPGYSDIDPRRYVDSRHVPYLALPKNINDFLTSDRHVKKGMQGSAERSGKLVSFIYADVRKSLILEAGGQFGEGSIALAEELDHDCWRQKSGIWRARVGISDQSVTYSVFSRS